MTLTASVEAIIRAQLSGAPDIGSSLYDFILRAYVAFANGTGANQVNNAFTDTRALAAAANESLDLAGGLVNALGATLTFTAIKVALFKAAAGNTNNVIIGGAASNAFVGWFADATDKLILPPGGSALIVAPTAAGWPVTAGTGDLLKVENSAGSTGVSYDIGLLGLA